MALIVHSEQPRNAETVAGVLAREDLTPVDAFFVRSMVRRLTPGTSGV